MSHMQLFADLYDIYRHICDVTTCHYDLHQANIIYIRMLLKRMWPPQTQPLPAITVTPIAVVVTTSIMGLKEG